MTATKQAPRTLTVDYSEVDDEQLLTLPFVCGWLGIAVQTGRNKVPAGTWPIPVVRIGSSIRFRAGDVRKFIADSTVPAAAA